MKKVAVGQGAVNYEVPGKLRFNFQNKEWMVPQAKMKRYLDSIIEKGKKIPSPDKYAPHRKNFNDLTKKSKIYMFERKNQIDEVIKDAKKTPGVGKYERFDFDEKRIKPARGLSKSSMDKYNLFDEKIYISSKSPSFHNQVEIVSIPISFVT